MPQRLGLRFTGGSDESEFYLPVESVEIRPTEIRVGERRVVAYAVTSFEIQASGARWAIAGAVSTLYTPGVTYASVIVERSLEGLAIHEFGSVECRVPSR